MNILRNFLSFCWLGSIYDFHDGDANCRFEEKFRRLHTINDEDILLHYIEAFKRQILLEKWVLSSHQASRFWFFVGMSYAHQCSWSATQTAFDLCERYIDFSDPMALFLLHSEWSVVAQAAGNEIQVIQSTSIALQTLLWIREIYTITLSPEEEKQIALTIRKWQRKLKSPIPSIFLPNILQTYFPCHQGVDAFGKLC